mgnify:CR=1 FL=1
MIRTICLAIAICLISFACSAQDDQIFLLVRADDMGFSHAGNEACIDVYKNGIARSVEVIVPAPWFPEAVTLLKNYPDYDVGIHLSLTSEWENMKWRPVSHAPSLVDENGYFYPTFWAGDNFPKEKTLTHNNWKAEDVEKELRAQIELAMKHIPNISHVSFHMGGNHADPTFGEIFNKLANEYGLMSSLEEFGVKRFDGFKGARDAGSKINNFLEALENVTPGKYLFVEHPGYDTPELRALHHKGYEDVAIDRDGVTKAWTDERVKAVIERRGIRLINYSDLKK